MSRKRYGTVLRCYDKPQTADRYTILPPRWAKEYQYPNGTFAAIGASAEPYHPQGVGQHTSASPGPHLGKRTHWRDLPPDVQRFACQAFPEYAPTTGEDHAQD
jgi:hypothetical protein